MNIEGAGPMGGGSPVGIASKAFGRPGTSQDAPFRDSFTDGLARARQAH